MQIVQDHKIEFKLADDEDRELPTIENPIFTYKEGDEFTHISFKEGEKEGDEEILYNKYRVTSIKHELSFIGEQTVVVGIEKVE